jgi:predicted transcriptional regulator
MIYIKEGNYYTLADIALRVGFTRAWVLKKATEMGIKPLKLGRLMTRYHEDDYRKIVEKLSIDNS